MFQIEKGGGLGAKENRSSKLRWIDTKSAFGSRIRSGMIINLKHKDIDHFLHDAFFFLNPEILIY
ncbi:hypothetical protein NQ318_007695 [Aromia moschata]|uniref:Uncharacterized protein n=1 Tax=Aromia moschata TaxID=1265417 RepID=A0AAV8XKL9_9CUCU|nr:hypothetical protein NQ318_007695 [Aromia moschata]